ncbi:MAG: fumarylacetoacetate hydrolase family protein [bacterium]|nr:fumarylacetoacetate hydrolase family protein [bacterium]
MYRSDLGTMQCEARAQLLCDGFVDQEGAGMLQSSIAVAARRLREAAESGRQCEPVRHLLGSDSDVSAAYAVQQVNTDLAVSEGRRITGRKIGLTSEAVQQQLGFGQPVSGVLFADRCVADGIDVAAGTLMQPRAEAEIAVVLGDDLDKGTHTVVDIISAIAYVLPAIEIVDSRIADWDLTVVDMVADNACSGFYVVGSTPMSLSDLRIRKGEVRMDLRLNGKRAWPDEGPEWAALGGHPLHALVWLADAMCDRGTPLAAGECVMTGSLGPMVPLSPGDEIDVGGVATRLATDG